MFQKTFSTSGHFERERVKPQPFYWTESVSNLWIGNFKLIVITWNKMMSMYTWKHPQMKINKGCFDGTLACLSLCTLTFLVTRQNGHFMLFQASSYQLLKNVKKLPGRMEFYQTGAQGQCLKSQTDVCIPLKQLHVVLCPWILSHPLQHACVVHNIAAR